MMGYAHHPALERLRQEDSKVKAIQGYILRTCLKNKQNNNEDFKTHKDSKNK